MSLYDKRDLQILEMLFYAKQGIGFSAIQKETGISRSALARHLNYLSGKIHYINKIPDENKRFFVYELTKEGSHEVIDYLYENGSISILNKDFTKKKVLSDDDYLCLKREFLEKRRLELRRKAYAERNI